MEITVEMPMVSGCSVTDCTYNQGSACHARAITIGDGVHPGCDTFFEAGSHTREMNRIAGVGACKVAGCTHNDDFECVADSIDVARSDQGIACMTFSPAR